MFDLWKYKNMMLTSKWTDNFEDFTDPRICHIYPKRTERGV